MGGQQAVLPEVTPAGQVYFSALMCASARTAQTIQRVPLRTTLSLPYLAQTLKLLLPYTSSHRRAHPHEHPMQCIMHYVLVPVLIFVLFRPVGTANWIQCAFNVNCLNRFQSGSIRFDRARTGFFQYIPMRIQKTKSGCGLV